MLRFSLVITLLVLVSCSNNKQAEKSNAEIKYANIDNSTLVELRLNEGKKWVADKKTHHHVDNILNMINLFAAFDDDQAIHELGFAVKEEHRLLLKECSMKGEPLDQLISLLEPIKSLLYKSTTEPGDHAYFSMKKIEARLAMFDFYFQ